MSVKRAEKLISIPSFPNLPTDVTPLIVRSMRSPSLRSLAQTTRPWSAYLKKFWNLDELNFDDAIKTISRRHMPLVTILNMTEKLCNGVSPRKAVSFMDYIQKQDAEISQSNWRNIHTLLSSRTKQIFPDSLQQSLADSPILEEDTTDYGEEISELIVRCFAADCRKRHLLEDVLEVCVTLPDCLKEVAFTTLMDYIVGRSNRPGPVDDDFWRLFLVDQTEFLSLMPKLLPKTWSPSLKIRSAKSFFLSRYFCHQKTYGCTYSLFFLAVQAYLQKFGDENPEFSFAILRLVMASANHLSPNKQNWKNLVKHLRNKNAYRQRWLMKDLLYSVIKWGGSDLSVKKKFTEILCDSGFMTLSRWKILEREAHMWYSDKHS